MASSKSLVSRPSIVTVIKSIKFILELISSCETKEGIEETYSNKFCGKLTFTSFWAMIF